MLYLFGSALAGFLIFFGLKQEGDNMEPRLNPDAWTRYDNLFKKYGRKYAVPWEWLKAVALNESDLGRHPSVVHGLKFPFDVQGSASYDGKSWGIMQVTLPTARALDKNASVEKLNNAEYSIEIGARVVEDNTKQFKQSDVFYMEKVIKSYNQGPNHTRNEFLGTPSNPTWQKHVQEYYARFLRNLKRVNDNK